MRIATPPSFVLAAAMLGGAPVAVASGPLPVRPSSDFSVSAAQPRRNFGAATQLVVAARPVSRAFVRFPLTASLPQGARVVLWLHSLSNAPAGVQVRRASDAAWRERAVTFRTAPRTGRRAAASGPLRRGQWKAIDVTKLAGSGRSLPLAITTTSARPVRLSSREARATAPRLTVTAPGQTGPVTGPSGSTAPSLGAPAPGPSLTAPSLPPFDVARPCGLLAQPRAWEHLVWIVMENKASSSILGAPDSPYTNALAGQCGIASNFFAEGHPSPPNYVAMTSGSTQGVTSNTAPTLDVPSIFSQLGAGWRTLAESMPANCARMGSGLYTPRHNPAIYYVGVAPACDVQNAPLADPLDLSARFTFIEPNQCSNTHSCAVAAGDAWLAQIVPKIINTPQYRTGTTAVFVTWDEASGGAGNQIATVIISPSTPAGAQDATRYDHYSMLRATEEMLGLPLLGNAATAPSLRAPFGL